MHDSKLQEEIYSQITAARLGAPMQLTTPKKVDHYDAALNTSIKKHSANLTFEDQSPNQLSSIEQKQAQAGFELKKLLENSGLGDHIQTAIQTLMDDGKKYLSPDVYEAMQLNFFDAKTSLDSLELAKPLDKCFDQILGINAETIDCIFKIAIVKYEEANPLASLSLFVFLTILQPNDFDFWYRTGIIAQQCENFDLALQAYAATIELNSAILEAHLFSSECYLKKGLHPEAKNACQQAEILIDASPLVKDEIKEFLKHLKKLVP